MSEGEKVSEPNAVFWPLPANVQRLTRCEFPRSRTLPGFTKPAIRFDRDAFDFPDDHTAFNFGVDLFNQGGWWEAHEIWEGVWHDQKQKSLARLGTGYLIQCANLNLKIECGKARGAARLKNICGGAIAEFKRRGGGQLFGLDLINWSSRFDDYLADIYASAHFEHDASALPRIEIPTNAGQA